MYLHNISGYFGVRELGLFELKGDGGVGFFEVDVLVFEELDEVGELVRLFNEEFESRLGERYLCSYLAKMRVWADLDLWWKLLSIWSWCSYDYCLVSSICS